MKLQNMKVAVLGAGGFVGARIMERSGLNHGWCTTPFLRSPRGLARIGKLGLDASLTVRQGVGDLAARLGGYHAVVNVAVGDPESISRDVREAYEACMRAGVGLFIHLSSAVVFGRVTSDLIHDDSPPDTGSWMLYARQKAQAENYLRSMMTEGNPKIVVLRPGLIWGPRSPWSILPAMHLASGTAWLGGFGKGHCNLIHVDNLVRCIERVVETGAPSGGFYNVGDPAQVTWREFYHAMASGLGYPLERVKLTDAGYMRLTPGAMLDRLREVEGPRRVMKHVLTSMSPAVKDLVKRMVPGLGRPVPQPPPRADAVPPASAPRLRRDIWVLHNTLHRLPTTKFVRDYGDPGLLSFEDGLAGTLEWLRFAGYAALDS